jgi:protease-4
MRLRTPLVTLAHALAALALVLSQAAAAPAGKPPATKDAPVIAVFTLDGAISERPANEALPIFGPPPTSLRSLIERIDKAGKDPNVKALVLVSEGAGIGLGQTEEICQAIARVRAAGKEVYAHVDSMFIMDFALFSSASRLSVVPNGMVWITGLRAEAPYARGLLDKIGVTPDFLTCGEYKSAAEIFMRSEPSRQSEEMYNWLLDGLFEAYVATIATGRDATPEKVRAWIDDAPYTAESAKAAGVIDAVEHREDFESMLRAKYGDNVVFDKQFGREKPPQIDFSSPLGVFKLWADLMAGPKNKPVKDGVAIVYVEGMIVTGTAKQSILGGDGAAMSSDIRDALDDAANDEKVKAVVLRIDSGGGSAVASEIILDATRRVKAKKPLIVSMGNVAGSGGYYVACGSDTIFADRATITGSIGVVAGKFVTTDMWNKVGITWKGYDRGENAALLSSDMPFTPAGRERVQEFMNRIYDTFKAHVTTARGNKLTKPLDEIAGGRVYTGKQALDLGLVDQLGSLSDAIAFAAEQAKLGEGYDVRVVPAPKNLLEMLMEDAAGGKNEPQRILAGPGGTSLLDLAAPYLQHLDPHRVRAVRTALRRLELTQREGLLMTMPEIILTP